MDKQKLLSLTTSHEAAGQAAQQEQDDKRALLQEIADERREHYRQTDAVAAAVFDIVSKVGECEEPTSRGMGFRQAANQRSGNTTTTTNPTTGKVKHSTQPPVHHKPRWRVPGVRDLQGQKTGVSQNPTTRTTDEFLTHTGNLVSLGVLDEDSDQPVTAYASFFFENGSVPTLKPETSRARVNVDGVITYREGALTTTGTKIGVKLFIEDQQGDLTEIKTFESSMPSPIERTALGACGANSGEQSRINWAVIQQFPEDQLAEDAHSLQEISTILDMAYTENPTLSPYYRPVPGALPPAQPVVPGPTALPPSS